MSVDHQRPQSCLHCALARAIRRESSGLAARGLAVNLGRAEAVWLPSPGARLYRALRRLLRQAGTQAEGSSLKLTVIDLTGKSHVEVTATIAVGRGSRVLSCAFPRHAPGSLGGGFAEALTVS